MRLDEKIDRCRRQAGRRATGQQGQHIETRAKPSSATVNRVDPASVAAGRSRLGTPPGLGQAVIAGVIEVVVERDRAGVRIEQDRGMVGHGPYSLGPDLKREGPP